MVTYSAGSLADIAEHFRRQGLDCERRAALTTGRLKRELQLEARTWGAASRILANTTLKEKEPHGQA